jgi:putative membrane protein
MEALLLIIFGVILGISAIIPGISFSTIAVSFNIYDRLIEIITPNIKKILAAWKFWVPLLIGIGIGIFLFSKLVTVLYKNYPIPTNWFFIGIIAGSIPLVYRKVQSISGTELPSKLPSTVSIISAIIALAVMVLFAVINPGETPSIYTELTHKLFVLFFLSGVLSAVAMIMPGISGSFMLLIIGMYYSVINAVSDVNILILCPLALGIIIGLFAGAAVIRFLLAKAPKATYGAVFGFVSGSIIVLFVVPDNGAALVFSVLCFLGGFAASFFMGRLQVVSSNSP